MTFSIFAILISQSVLGKIGYHQSFEDDMEIEVIEAFSDNAYDYRGGYGNVYNTWFPYQTLADCEELCRASATCVTATYEKDSSEGGWAGQLHGKCHLNYGTPKIVPNTNEDDPTRMTITKKDKGRLSFDQSQFVNMDLKRDTSGLVLDKLKIISSSL